MAHPLGDAVREHVARQAREAERVQVFGVVKAVDPFIVELEDTRIVLHDDEITLSQWTKRYHAKDSIDEGDTVVITRRRTGGEIHWIVTDVLADKDVT